MASRNMWLLLAARPCYATSPLTRCSAIYPALLRHASTTTYVPQSSARPPYSSAAFANLNSPLSTLPAQLDIPPRSPDTSRFTHAFRTGKSYLAFFKTGLKNVLYNFRVTRPLQSRIDAGDGTMTLLVARNQLTRAEFQHIVRTRHDMRRLPVFALIFLLCGELSPFVLPFVSGLVPYTCRIPRQLERERRVKAKRVEESFRRIGEREKIVGLELRELKGKEVWHVAKCLGVEPRWIPLVGLASWRVQKRCEYLGLDDILIERGGGVRGLDPGEELVMAVQERGIETRGKTEKELREAMELWVSVRRKLGEIKPGWWLTRPENWSVASGKH